MLQARIKQHICTDTKPTHMRIVKLQRGEVVANQAYANRGYGQLFPFGKLQWTAAKLESRNSSGVEWEGLPEMPLSSPCNSDADVSDMDDDACVLEHD